jgi:hypothetical protein
MYLRYNCILYRELKYFFGLYHIVIISTINWTFIWYRLAVYFFFLSQCIYQLLYLRYFTIFYMYLCIIMLFQFQIIIIIHFYYNYVLLLYILIPTFIFYLYLFLYLHIELNKYFIKLTIKYLIIVVFISTRIF